VQQDRPTKRLTDIYYVWDLRAGIIATFRDPFVMIELLYGAAAFV